MWSVGGGGGGALTNTGGGGWRGSVAVRTHNTFAFTASHLPIRVTV